MKLLEDKLKALEEKQGGNTVSAALSSVRNALQKPGTVYDPSEESAHVEALVRAARSVAHEKVDYYAAILDELKGSSSSLSSSAHQRLLLRLLGDPTRAKVAKESSALLKPFELSPAQAPTPICPQSISLLQMRLARVLCEGLLSRTRSWEL